MEDMEHSNTEKRYYCIGKVNSGIMNVRFTYRKNKIRIIGAGYCGKEKKYMKKKIKYTDEPIGKVKIISDFLPSPEKLAMKDESIKITIALSKASVEFFKKEAKKYNTQYQKMIRKLLDEYMAHQS